MRMPLSVIVCCYNSVARLPMTLQHLAFQKAEAQEWELIIVDNNSTDGTSEHAKALWDDLGSTTPLTIIKENNPGLSHARAAGIRQSQYELILFCDDDNWLDDEYIATACEIMSSSSSIGIIGGLNTAVSSTEFPFWFKRFEQAYACGPQAIGDGEVSADRLYITGAGMVIRRDIFKLLASINFSSNLTDRKGEELSSGGDAELCFVAAMLGYKIVYSSSLKLSHFIEPKRLTWDYFLKLIKGHAKSYYRLTFYKRIYEGESVNTSWVDELNVWRKRVFNRTGLILLYQVFYKVNRAVGDEFSIDMLSYSERFKAFLAMRKEYANFINSVQQLSIDTKKVSKRN